MSPWVTVEKWESLSVCTWRNAFLVKATAVKKPSSGSRGGSSCLLDNTFVELLQETTVGVSFGSMTVPHTVDRWFVNTHHVSRQQHPARLGPRSHWALDTRKTVRGTAKGPKKCPKAWSRQDRGMRTSVSQFRSVEPSS